MPNQHVMPGGTDVQQLIDLRSDTVSLPSPDMRRAMYEAELGDDYYRDDPTVRALEEWAAELLGKEAAMLVLSGTMGNLVAILAQAGRGDSVVLETTCHIANNEASHLSTLGSVATVTVKGEDGFFTPEQLEGAIFPRSVLHPPTRVVCLENTHNAAGGRCMSQAQIDTLCATAVRRGLAVHVDGLEREWRQLANGRVGQVPHQSIESSGRDANSTLGQNGLLPRATGLDDRLDPVGAGLKAFLHSPGHSLAELLGDLKHFARQGQHRARASQLPIRRLSPVDQLVRLDARLR